MFPNQKFEENIQFAQKAFPSFSRYAVTRSCIITIRHQEDCVTTRGCIRRNRSGKFLLLHNLNREDENLLGDPAILCMNINGLFVSSRNSVRHSHNGAVTRREV